MKKPTVSLFGAAAAAVVSSGTVGSLVVPAVPLLAPAVLSACSRPPGTPATDTAQPPGTQEPLDTADTDDTDTDAG